MERAASHNQGPLVLADRADNPGSGAPGDSTFVLRALVERQIGPALFGVMWDPMAFRIAEQAGEGARLRMRLGGKSGEVSGDPVDLDVASPGAADPDVARLPYTKRKMPFWPKVADPWT